MNDKYYLKQTVQCKECDRLAKRNKALVEALAAWVALANENPLCSVGYALSVIQEQNAALHKEVESLQAMVDSLMLEFCPEDMTPEQVAQWGQNQVVSKTQFPPPTESKDNGAQT